MDIKIDHRPPDDIPLIRKQYRRAAMICLGVIAASLIMGAATVFYETGYNTILEYAAFGLFVASGFIFVYFTEKLMGYRRLGIKQKKELLALRKKHEDVEQYCRQVTSQGRYIVVNEYDAIVAHIEKVESTGRKTDSC